MKKLNYCKCTILLLCLLFSGFNIYAQGELRPKIYAALQAYVNKDYLKSAQLYTKDFTERHYRVPLDKMLYAARMWALAGQPDSAFSQLNRLAKEKYPQILDDIFTDDAFNNLKNDSRWITLTDLLRSAGIRPEQAVKKNYMLIAELAIIDYDDQHYRTLSINADQKYGSGTPEAVAANRLEIQHDSVNQQKVKAIIDKYNWPKSSEIDKEGSDAIFLVIQHASLAMQLKYVSQVKEAVKKGLLDPGSLATLEDRMAMRQNKYQTYGSQIAPYYKTGKLYRCVYPLLDPDNVDKRRAEVGLGPLKEYVKQWDIDWDVEQYKKDLPLIKKMVGWSNFDNKHI